MLSGWVRCTRAFCAECELNGHFPVKCLPVTNLFIMRQPDNAVGTLCDEHGDQWLKEHAAGYTAYCLANPPAAGAAATPYTGQGYDTTPNAVLHVVQQQVKLKRSGTEHASAGEITSFRHCKGETVREAVDRFLQVKRLVPKGFFCTLVL